MTTSPPQRMITARARPHSSPRGDRPVVRKTGTGTGVADGGLTVLIAIAVAAGVTVVMVMLAMPTTVSLPFRRRMGRDLAIRPEKLSRQRVVAIDPAVRIDPTGARRSASETETAMLDVGTGIVVIEIDTGNVTVIVIGTGTANVTATETGTRERIANATANETGNAPDETAPVHRQIATTPRAITRDALNEAATTKTTTTTHHHHHQRSPMTITSGPRKTRTRSSAKPAIASASSANNSDGRLCIPRMGLVVVLVIVICGIKTGARNGTGTGTGIGIIINPVVDGGIVDRID